MKLIGQRESFLVRCNYLSDKRGGWGSVGGSDLGDRREDRYSNALRWRFAGLCRWEGVI